MVPDDAGATVTPALVALDLDQTVVFSERSAGEAGPSVVVEHLDGAPLSSMTVGAVAAYRALARRARVVPVTTRTVAQYARITLPAPSPHAVCANGGVLLVDGVRDPDWDAWVRWLLAGVAPVEEVRAHLGQWEGSPWVRLVRTAEGLFVYLVAQSREEFPDGWLEDLAAALEPRGWSVSVQGRKAYAVPAGLTKAAAVERLSAQLGADRVLAAGDSLLDAPLLELGLSSGGAVRPAHGELHDLGWCPTGLHVTTASGALAGEELLGWLAERL
ncbi:MAG: hypothetical protein JWM64_2106 [Frankiales bacterium]|nr:hypothetical protein [Frankiales bacterium]